MTYGSAIFKIALLTPVEDTRVFLSIFMVLVIDW
ncbi:hypothetical protein E2C01_006670 [Portunus trituberculatus]|uniref:Uncharacterized protein n=1 Tax=Portunus trituberculatus TaxID=210409 RepID=A0A5B7CYG1_PORTR|nr:hypothetical protein [Portunus trituberculatus]